MDVGKVFSAILYFIAAIVEVLLIFRFALQLFAANSSAEFTQWIYSSTDPFVGPFKGVFPDFEVAFVTVELSSILAIIVYGVGTIVLVQLIKAFEGFIVRPTGPKGGVIQNPVMQNNPSSPPQTQFIPNQPSQPMPQQYPNMQQNYQNPQMMPQNQMPIQPIQNQNMNPNFENPQFLNNQNISPEPLLPENADNNQSEFRPYPHNQDNTSQN